MVSKIPLKGHQILYSFPDEVSNSVGEAVGICSLISLVSLVSFTTSFKKCNVMMT